MPPDRFLDIFKMEKLKKITVVIPCRNEEKGINCYDFGITAFTVLQKLKKGKGKVQIYISSRNVG